MEALAAALGPVGMARFLKQFDAGKADYSQDRAGWLDGITLQDAVDEIKRRRNQE